MRHKNAGFETAIKESAGKAEYGKPLGHAKLCGRVLRRQACVMPPLVRRGCEICVMKQHCYAAFEVCRRPATGKNESRRSGAHSKNRRPLFACSFTELSGHE